MATFCFVVSLKASPAWLSRSRETRTQAWAAARTVLAQYENKVTFDYHDADAFDALCSDFVINETQDPLQFHHLWDELKDTDLFTQNYYSITDVKMGIKGVTHRT